MTVPVYTCLDCKKLVKPADGWWSPSNTSCRCKACLITDSFSCHMVLCFGAQQGWATSYVGCTTLIFSLSPANGLFHASHPIDHITIDILPPSDAQRLQVTLWHRGWTMDVQRQRSFCGLMDHLYHLSQ